MNGTQPASLSGVHPANLQEITLWLLRRRVRFRINGDSMRPALKPGDEVLIDPRAYCHKLPVPGEIVVAWHPYQKNYRIIKRVHAVTQDGKIELWGDSFVDSTDSRSFGFVEVDQIIGRVTSLFF